MYEYELTKGRYIIEGKFHTGYGIALKASGIYDAVCFSDITTNREKAEKIIALCNELQLSPIHLQEVVCDFMSFDFVE